MSSAVRGFSTSARVAIKYGGKVSLSDIASANDSTKPGSGKEWQNSVEKCTTEMEGTDPRIKEAKIQGAKAHTSSRDKTDTEDVITVGFHSENGTRLYSAHVHQNGSFKYWPSRAGR